MKSGTDFLDFSKIKITFDVDEQGWNKIAKDLLKDGYKMENNKVYSKKRKDETRSMIIHSDEN